MLLTLYFILFFHWSFLLLRKLRYSLGLWVLNVMSLLFKDTLRRISRALCFKILMKHGGRSLIQVTLALAIAEAAYEFEHRDLHWFIYLLYLTILAPLLLNFC